MIAWNPVRSDVLPVHPSFGISTGIRMLLVASALLLTPGAARAQGTVSPPQRQDSRWWVGGGGGYLAIRSDCTNCTAAQPYGNSSAFLLQGGLRVKERLLVGGELFRSGRTVTGIDLHDTYLLAIAQFRPLASHGFFFKIGYGKAFVKESFKVGSAEVTARTRGMGLMYGAGWIFRQGRRISVAPFAAQYVTTAGDIQTPTGTAQNVVANGWFVGAVLMVR